jgi:glucose/arabinose dehydrogenase
MRAMRRPALAAALLTLALAGCTGPSPTPTVSPPVNPSATASRPSSTASPAAPSPTASASPTATGGASASPSATPLTAVGLAPFADGFGPLVLLTHAGDGSGRVYAVGQEGVISVVGADGAIEPEPFLDISDRLNYGGERGLLGLAFHPDHATNGRLFVNYTDDAGDTVVAEFARSADGAAADPASERVLLTIDQPFPNHNGGMVVFGHDGYLYISSGDGGSAGDPLGSGQDLGSLLGKILRIDVDSDAGAAAYTIPADNPFADGAGGARREVWAFGLRNPWRITFDRETGALFIGDVGQGTFEEVNAEPAGSGGRNYGWNVMEGPRCFRSAGCDQAGLTLPVAAYQHRNDGTCSITGGYVYRGTALPGLAGTYLFSDYCTGTLWGIDAAAAVAGEQVEPVVLAESGLAVTGFGEDESGEIYLVGRGGEIARVVAP